MSNETTGPDEGTGATEAGSTTADEQSPDETSEPDAGVSDAGVDPDAGEPIDEAAEAFADLAGESTDRDATVPTDVVFELLASPGNRFVLTYLLRVEDPATRDDLVEYVVARADPPEELTEGTFRGRVAARLVHSNLPKLADAGLVELDEDAGTVSATPAIERVAPYLALAISQSKS